ncbi:MAG: 2-oxo acid dehydrogenase subunit E2 [Deltaproteobacteria bacterium]|nr:2-oxo acid dehydrogenase subunit E2 [Deltaproteobacteria bacterium]
MAFEFKLPDIGEGVVEGEIVKWHIKPGDLVAEDQPMVEVMTDKATVVIPSPRAGRVVATHGNEGDIAKVGGVLVVIEESGGAAAVSKAAPAMPAPGPAPTTATAAATAPAAPRAMAGGGMAAAAVEAPRPAPRTPAPAAATSTATATAPAGAAAAAAPEPRTNGHRQVLAAPATRRLARELGIDLAEVSGSGPGGRVTSEDVRRAQQAPRPAPAATRAPAAMRPPRAATVALEERVPVRALRKRIWENMARSKASAAHFTFVEECDCSALVEARDRFNAKLRDGEVKLSYLPFIVKAIIAAFKQYPDLNGHVDEQSMEFVRRRDYHLGIAAATERGLIVPVVRDADRLSLLELAQEIKRLGDLAREGRLGAEDLGGSTFTITSLGKDGGIFATPIINHPEVAIMGVHKMVKRPMVDEEDRIVIKPMMNLSLSFDHRLIDGHVGAAFTYAVVRLLENPDRLLMEMA